MYVKFTSRKRSKLNDVWLRWCSPTAKEQLFLSSSQPQLLSVFPPPPSSPSVMLLWNTLQLEIFMASFPLHVRGLQWWARGLFPSDGVKWAPPVFAHKPPRLLGLSQILGGAAAPDSRGYSKRLWVSPVALQCVTDLLFSFKFFWNACKL